MYPTDLPYILCGKAVTELKRATIWFKIPLAERPEVSIDKIESRMKTLQQHFKIFFDVVIYIKNDFIVYNYLLFIIYCLFYRINPVKKKSLSISN